MAVGLASGCGCGGFEITGTADAGHDEANGDSLDLPDDDPADEDGTAVDGCPDSDGDGHEASWCGGDDCDDTDPAAHPGASEVCGDGVDQDCDGLTGEAGEVFPLSDPIMLVHRSTGGVLRGTLEWTGSEFGFVWFQYGGAGLFLERIGADGGILDDHVLIREGVDSGGSAAWVGGAYGIGWIDTTGGTDDLVFEWVDGTGAAIGSELSISSTVGAISSFAHVLALGGDAVLFWEETPEEGATTTKMATVDPSGATPPEVLDVPGPGDFGDAAVGGSAIGVAWSAYCSPDGCSIALTRMTTHGDVLSSGTIAPDGHLSTFSLEWTGSSFAVVSITHLEFGTSVGSMELFRFSPEGEPNGEPVVLAGPDIPLGYALGATWTGRALLIVWVEYETEARDNPRTMARLFDPDGTPIGDGATIIQASVNEVGRTGLVWTGSEAGIYWAENIESMDHYFMKLGACD